MTASEAKRARHLERMRARIGERIGTRVIVDVVVVQRAKGGGRTSPQDAYLLRCDCGAELRAVPHKLGAACRSCVIRESVEATYAAAQARVGERHGQRVVTGVVQIRGTLWLRTLCGACGSEARVMATRPLPSCAGCLRALPEPGTVIGGRTVLAAWVQDYRACVRVACSCGTVSERRLDEARRAPRCLACAARLREARREVRAVAISELDAQLSEIGRECPGVWRVSCSCGAGERCRVCRAQVQAVGELVTVLGRPLTLSEAGALLGVTRQRAQQIEATGLRAARACRWAAELAEDERAVGSWSAWGASAELAAW